MTADYFDDEGNWLRLVAEVESWKGTPFVDSCGAQARKQVAADCVSFCERALANVGAIAPVTFPDRYVTCGGGAEMLQVFLRIMDGITGLSLVWERPTYPAMNFRSVKRGDLILCSSGKALHHLALYMGGNQLVHCFNNGRGVQDANIHDPVIAKHILRVYRPRYAFSNAADSVPGK